MNARKLREDLLNMQENMMNFALMLTSNREDARDLLQDATLKVLDNQDKYVENVNFRGWVLTVMRNLFINNYHKVVRSHTMVDHNANLYNLEIANESGFYTPDASFRLKEIAGAIENLNYELKIPFSMYVSGYKYVEISQYLKVPLGTVKSRIFFARQELQTQLKDYR